ncbi:14805_t:CDS:1 [Dentiscutata heterogama]|uniref:14805_t:CDS:1 n=1 Tax=Dentiscutata heterogama TaxID=1316150 RepID=A0ACA9NL61_9GLOM|nr:14805_t:CDS:1 [Dentiscutata heterogama]
MAQPTFRRGPKNIACNECKVKKVACRGIFLFCSKWEEVQNCSPRLYVEPVPATRPCVRCANIKRSCNGAYALCYRFPWHLYHNKHELVLKDKNAPIINGQFPQQTFDNPTPSPETLPIPEFEITLPPAGPSFSERGAREISIKAKVCKMVGSLYKEITMEIDTQSDVTWISLALFNFLNLEKIDLDEVITGYDNTIISVYCATLLYIKINKIKVYTKVYVDKNAKQIGGLIGKDIIKAMNMNILTKEGAITVTYDDQTFIVPMYVGKKTDNLQIELSDHE